jgi:hypothetical protein
MSGDYLLFRIRAGEAAVSTALEEGEFQMRSSLNNKEAKTNAATSTLPFRLSRLVKKL